MASKNKENSGKGKAPIESQDEFVSGTLELAERLRPHARGIAAAAGVVFLALTGWFVYQHLDERGQAAATVQYQEILSLADRGVSPEGASAPGDGESAEEFPSHEARATAMLAALEKLQAEHGSTRTAQSARLLHASLLFDLGRYQEAADMYRAYASGAPTASLRWVAREGQGYALEALALARDDEGARQAGLQEALEAFRQIQPGDTGPHRDYALYHEARILAQLGQTAEAIAALQKALEVAPQSLLTSDIKQRLAQLEAPAME